MLGFLAGVAVAMWIASTARGTQPSLPSAGRDPRCTGSVIFIAPDRSRPEQVLLDDATGGYGYSHVVVDDCELGPDGEPLLWDCHAGEGVRRAPWSRYDGRFKTHYELDAQEAAAARAALRALEGQPYSLGSPLDGEGMTCAGLVYAALPDELRARIDETPVRGALEHINPDALTPNRIAEALGVPAYHG